MGTTNSSESDGVVGVLGGMGPLATLDFMRKMLDATPAVEDQDHVPVVVSSIPQIPGRTAAFRGEGESPLSAMIASGQRLVRAGAGLIVMPCNTAHLWFDELQQALALPMLHLVDAALEDAVATVGADGRVGLLATDATLASGLYMNRRTPAGVAHDLHWQSPTSVEMTRWVQPGIAAVKAGRLPEARELLTQAVFALKQRGAAAVVLGCTEIPLALDAAHAPLPLIDATASLARRAVAWSTAQRRHD